MSHAIEELIGQLRVAREQKGLSQRELSTLSGVPQSHISKIENGGVDLRVSSLVEIARALDLELTLVQRKALPAVTAVARNVMQATKTTPALQLEFDRLAQAIKAASAAVPAPALQDAQRRLRALKRTQPLAIEPEILKNLQRSFEQVRKTGSIASAEKAAKRLRSLSHQFANPLPDQQREDSPRPAYRLEDDDD